MMDKARHIVSMRDSGAGEHYQRGEAAWTELSASRKKASMRIEIAAQSGNYQNMSTERGYEVDLPGDWPPRTVTVNGKRLPYLPSGDGPGWHYDGAKLATIVLTDRYSVTTTVRITVDRDPALEAQRWKLDGLAGVVDSFRSAELAMTNNIPLTHAPESLATAAEFAMRVTYRPENIEHEVDLLLASGAKVLADVARAQEHDQSELDKAVGRAAGGEQSALFKQREADYAARQEEATFLVEKAVTAFPKRPVQ